jgi:hypothetical protein
MRALGAPGFAEAVFRCNFKRAMRAACILIIVFSRRKYKKYKRRNFYNYYLPFLLLTTTNLTIGLRVFTILNYEPTSQRFSILSVLRPALRRNNIDDATHLKLVYDPPIIQNSSLVDLLGTLRHLQYIEAEDEA